MTDQVTIIDILTPDGRTVEVFPPQETPIIIEWTDERGPQGPAGPAGPPGTDGTSVAIKGSVDTPADLPPTGNAEGDGYISNDTGHLWVWDGTKWVDAGLIQGPEG